MHQVLLVMIYCFLVGPDGPVPVAAQDGFLPQVANFATGPVTVSTDPPPIESMEAEKTPEESKDVADDQQTGDEAEGDKEATDEEDGGEEATDEVAGEEEDGEEADGDKEVEGEEAADEEAEDEEAEDEEAEDEEAEDGADGGDEDGSEKDGEGEAEEKKDTKGKKGASDAESKKGSSGKEASSGKQSSDQEQPEPYLVERKPLKIEVELAGTWVAREMVEVALRPKVWAQFKVLETVRHGAQIHKGDVLARFDDVKIEDTLAEKALDQRIEELDLMVAEEELPRLEKLAAIDYESTRRAHEELVAEYERFRETLRPLSEKIANFNFRSAQESLAMEQEELDQLRKMYLADDLTEETEKIVLHRQQFAVEMAQLYVEYARFNRGYTLNVSLPRREEKMATALEQSKFTLERAKMSKSLGLNKVRYELEKKRALRARNVDKHAKLLGDRALMVLKAPADGVVYYGRCVDGKWTSATSLRTKLRPFGSVAPGTVLFTIVQQGSMGIVSTVSEKDFPQIQDGLAAAIWPTGDSELELEGKVAHVESIPISRGKFPLQIDFDQTSAPDWIVAGMTCKVKVTTYENKEAILIPEELVETDKENKKRKYVLVLDEEEDEPLRRKVKLGHRKGKSVEVVKGLDGGEKLLKPAKDKEKEKDKK
jgi:multidrug resistance efflux pump